MEHTHPTGYYFPSPSKWPVVGSTALFFMALGAALLASRRDWAPPRARTTGPDPASG